MAVSYASTDGTAFEGSLMGLGPAQKEAERLTLAIDHLGAYHDVAVLEVDTWISPDLKWVRELSALVE